MQRAERSVPYRYIRRPCASFQYTLARQSPEHLLWLLAIVHKRRAPQGIDTGVAHLCYINATHRRHALVPQQAHQHVHG